MNHLKGDYNLGNNLEEYMTMICYQCGAEFAQEGFLMNHILENHYAENYEFRSIVKCRHCHELFNAVPALHTHLLYSDCLLRTASYMSLENETENELGNEDMNKPTVGIVHASRALKRRLEPLIDCSTSTFPELPMREDTVKASYKVKKCSLKSSEFVNDFTTNGAELIDPIDNDDYSNDNQSKLDQSYHISEKINQTEEGEPNNKMMNNSSIELVDFSDKDLDDICEIILEELNKDKAQKLNKSIGPVNASENKLNNSSMQQHFTLSNDEVENLSTQELIEPSVPDNICRIEDIVTQCFDSSVSDDGFEEIGKTVGNSAVFELENNNNEVVESRETNLEEVCEIKIEEMKEVNAQNCDKEAIQAPIAKQLNVKQPNVEIQWQIKNPKKLLTLLKELVLYICPVCGKDIGELQMWQDHVILGHDFKKCVTNNFVKADNIQEIEYYCLKCSKFLCIDSNGSEVLARHFLKHVAFKSYIRCTLCNQTTSTRPKMCCHLVYHHRREVGEIIQMEVEALE